MLEEESKLLNYHKPLTITEHNELVELRGKLCTAKELIRGLLPFAKRPLDAPIEVLQIKQSVIADAEQFIKENE